MSKGSKLLAAYLAEHALKLDTFADSVASTKSYISMLKLGRVRPGLGLAARIEKVAGIPCTAWTELEAA